jgi:hypothetical protein
VKLLHKVVRYDNGIPGNGDALTACGRSLPARTHVEASEGEVNNGYGNDGICGTCRRSLQPKLGFVYRTTETQTTTGGKP